MQTAATPCCNSKVPAIRITGTHGDGEENDNLKSDIQRFSLSLLISKTAPVGYT